MNRQLWIRAYLLKMCVDKYGDLLNRHALIRLEKLVKQDWNNAEKKKRM